jgi:serine/threonine protein phosphatase PrpC
LIIGRTLYVSNVGDSRAIILSKRNTLNTNGSSNNMSAGVDITAKFGDKTRLAAAPLSSDQTPYRKDERERVMRRGARVLTQDQIDGVKPIGDTFDNLTLGSCFVDRMLRGSRNISSL